MKTDLCLDQVCNWGTARLEDICSRITSGGTPRRRTPGYYTDSTGVPWVRTQELQDVILHETEEHITEEALANSSAKLLPAGTLLMAMYAAPTAGRMAILGRAMACNQAACAFIFDEERADTRYMFYQLRHSRPDLHRLANGAAQQNLSARVLRDLEVVLPPLDEQRRIAGALGSLDDLIETNQKLIQDLEATGSLLLEGALPRDMTRVDGPASDGWDLTTLDSGCSVIEAGRRPKGGVAGIRSGVPSIGAESVDGLASFDFSKVKYVPRDFYEAMKRGRVASGDVLIYKDGGTPGNFLPKVGMVGQGFPFDEMSINEHVFRVRVPERLSNGYLYFWLRSRRMLDEMHRAGTGAAIPGINRTAFGSLPLAVPPADMRESLCRSLDVLTDSALILATEGRHLTCVRDELLPLLMSGRVRVGDVAA